MAYEQGLWNRLVNDKWPAGMTAPDADEAIRGARRLYRKAFGKPWRGPVRLTSGNRHTWIRRGVLVVNPDGWPGGWRGIVHDLSHYAHARLNPDDRPHATRQVYIERDLTDYAIRAGFPDGRLKPAAKPAPNPAAVRAAELAKLDRRIAGWETRLTRATHALVRLNRERRRLAGDA